MTKVIAELVLVVLVLFMASVSPLSNKSINTRAEIPSDSTIPTANAENIHNAENLEENVGRNIASSEEAGMIQSTVSGDYSQFQSKANQDTNSSTKTNPSLSDGVIYYGGEPPYAYIPTYDPREPNTIRIPNVPPELGN